MKNRLVTACLSCFMAPAMLSGQDLHFSQFNQLPLLLNPALTAAFPGTHRAVAAFRDQWSALGAPYRTIALSYDMPVLQRKWKAKHLGAGITALNDRAGDYRFGTTLLLFSLSSFVSLDKHQFLSGGIQGGLAQRSVDYSGLKTGNQYNPALPDFYNADPAASREKYSAESFLFADMGAGLSWSYVKREKDIAARDQLKASAGFAVQHVNRPKQKFYSANAGEAERLFAKWTAHGSAYFGLSRFNMALVPSLLLMRQGPSMEVNAGGMVRYQIKEESRYTGWVKETAVYFGGFYRVGDAFIPSFMFEIANYALGISYDFNLSGLRTATNGQGGVEITLRFINPNPFRYGKGTQGIPMI